MLLYNLTVIGQALPDKKYKYKLLNLCKLPKFPLHSLSDGGILPLKTREERSVIVL